MRLLSPVFVLPAIGAALMAATGAVLRTILKDRMAR